MSASSQDASERRKKMYQRGATTVFASKADARFAYCMYVPETFDEDPSGHTLIVTIHGTGRTMTVYRDALSHFCRYNKCLVLSPLFPVGVLGDDNPEGFKYMREGDIRYDEILLAMVDEVSQKLGARFDRFMMFGFSGGGHFVHRFLYLHPNRLLAASIGAPGAVTLIDPTRDFWVGTRNLKELFGIDLDLDAMRQVAVQMVVGGADIETWEIDYKPGSVNYMEGIKDTGRTRIERNTALRRNFEEHGIQVRQDIVPNVPHDGAKVIPTVEDFFLDVLKRHRNA